MKYKLVLDVGTTTIRVALFDEHNNLISKQSARLSKQVSLDKHVEQNPEEIFSVGCELLRKVIVQENLKQEDIIGIGIANQRETVVLWNKNTGKPIYPAIVWEDERTAKWCQENSLKFGNTVLQKTGLPLIPYFSASKISWVLNNVTNNKEDLFSGTIDTWLVWNLTGRKNFVTDYTNSSRTLLFNIKTLDWDDELLSIFSIDRKMLPIPKFSKSDFGYVTKEILGFEIPILGICADQQASCFAAGTEIGTTKITYGTGTFLMQLIPEFLIKPPFLTTLAVGNSVSKYALEAKIGRHGNLIDELLQNKQSLEPLITEIAVKVNEYLLQLPIKPKELILDGGITQAPKLSQIQDEISGIPVRLQVIHEGTALGVAKLIGV